MANSDKDTEIDLPLVHISKQDVLGAMFVYTDNVGEMYKDALLKLQTWIINFTEELIAPLRESNAFSEEELEKIHKRNCVVSPITVALYLHWLQREKFTALPNSEKEKHLLEGLPDQFKARYKGNASCRKAREVSPEEENEKEEILPTLQNPQEGITFDEFLKELGKKIKESNKGE